MMEMPALAELESSKDVPAGTKIVPRGTIPICTGCQRQVRNDDDHQDAGYCDANGDWWHYGCSA